MPTNGDEPFAAVRAWIDVPEKLERIGTAIRLAFDWVIDGPRTGRYSIDQLETTEKIYIGNRVEHEILHELGLPKVPPLDTVICGAEVDIKFSLAQNWMIPPEAVGKLCLIVTANDVSSLFSVGLLRALPKWLGTGSNRDGKRSISAAGKLAISWMSNTPPLPSNFLLNLDPTIRSEILALTTGQQRVNEVFRRMIGHPISTNALDTLAVQRDPSKRVRDARKTLMAEGIGVFGARYDKEMLAQLGCKPLKPDYWISLRVDAGTMGSGDC